MPRRLDVHVFGTDLGREAPMTLFESYSSVVDSHCEVCAFGTDEVSGAGGLGGAGGYHFPWDHDMAGLLCQQQFAGQQSKLTSIDPIRALKIKQTNNQLNQTKQTKEKKSKRLVVL